MCGLKSWEIACKNTVTHSLHQETNSIWFEINKHKQKHNFLNWRAEEPCKRDQKKKVCIQLSSCLLLPFRKIFTSSNASSGGKPCSIYPPCSARLMYILLHTAAPLLVHLSWGLLPKHIWPPCLPFPTASSTAPKTAGKLKWQRKAPHPECILLVSTSSREVVSLFPGVHLFFIKGQITGLGPNKLKAATVHHGKNKGFDRAAPPPRMSMMAVQPIPCSDCPYVGRILPRTQNKNNSPMCKSPPKQRALARFPRLF